MTFAEALLSWLAVLTKALMAAARLEASVGSRLTPVLLKTPPRLPDAEDVAEASWPRLVLTVAKIWVPSKLLTRLARLFKLEP